MLETKPYSVILLLALVLMWSSGCEKEAKLDLGPIEPKLVVTCFISPQDTVLSALVTKSVPITQKGSFTDPFLVDDAYVELSDGLSSVQLQYGKRKNYTIAAKELPIVLGKTYFLRVVSPDGLEVNATCTVPANQAEIGEARTYYVTDDKRKEYFAVFDWQDLPQEKNYYEVAMRIKLPSAPAVQYYSSAFFDQPPLTTDDNQDGELLTSATGRFIIYGEENPVALQLYLLQEDFNMYQFRLTSNSLNQADGDPFLTSQNVYSNVVGGLGVFGAYTRTTKEISLN